MDELPYNWSQRDRSSKLTARAIRNGVSLVRPAGIVADLTIPIVRAAVARQAGLRFRARSLQQIEKHVGDLRTIVANVTLHRTRISRRHSLRSTWSITIVNAPTLRASAVACSRVICSPRGPRTAP